MFNEKLLEHDPLTEGVEGGRLNAIIMNLQKAGLWEKFMTEPRHCTHEKVS